MPVRVGPVGKAIMTLCARDSRLQDFNGAMQNEEHAGNASLDHFSSYPARRLLETTDDQRSHVYPLLYIHTDRPKELAYDVTAMNPENGWQLLTLGGDPGCRRPGGNEAQPLPSGGRVCRFENVMRLAKDIGPELPRLVKPDGSSIEEAVSLRRLPPNSI